MDAAGGSGSERSTIDSAEARKRAAVGIIKSHDSVFRRTARRYSICGDDAEDAYQRALEILLTKAPPIDGDALVRWMQTVTKREALALRRQRERLLSAPRPSADGGEDRDPLESIASESPEPTDRAASRERVARSGEALRALKPHEVRALTLKAEGYSYAEIGELTGWSYTKINRCMAEGRKRFFEVFSDIEEGRRCDELAPALSALADGEGGNGDHADVHAHLRSCQACRAKLRAFREIPRTVLELMPVMPALDASVGGRPHEWIAERATGVLDKAREAAYSVMSRGANEDTVRLASGGSRGAGMTAVAKVLAVCGATAAGGATCVATGVVDPGWGGSKPAAVEQAAPESLAQAGKSDAATAAEGAGVGGSAAASPLKPAQQANREVGFERAAPASGTEFGGPSGGGGGGSSGSGGGGGGFGFEH